MKHRAVIVIPIVAFLLVVSYSTILVAQTQWPDLNIQTFLASYIPLKDFSSVMTQYLPHTSANELEGIVNQLRLESGKEPLISNPLVCGRDFSLGEGQYTACPNCSHAAILKISNRGYPEQIKQFLLADESVINIINSPNITHYCTITNENMLTLYVASYNVSNQPTPTTSTSTSSTGINQITKPKTITNFSENELWQALVNYRQAHQRTDLIRDESICQYARKRVQDHLTQYETRSPEDYPIPDKYPLDAHEGFAADADSGRAFEMAGKNRLAENLAYWPGAEYANQIIEWGWDSSTEGHREAQLSEDYSHACITGQDGFYVAIFGG